MNQKTLYQRLGGYDAIASIVDDLERRFAEDPELNTHRLPSHTLSR